MFYYCFQDLITLCNFFFTNPGHGFLGAREVDETNSGKLEESLRMEKQKQQQAEAVDKMAVLAPG